MLSALKNFFVTLLIALVIFGIVAYFASLFVTDTMSSILSSEKEQLDDIFEREEDGMSPIVEPTPETDPFEDVEGESFSFLLVITDYRPDLYIDYISDRSASASGDPPPSIGETTEVTNEYDNVGILTAPYRSEAASAMVLVRGDKERGQFTYTYLSPQTRVYTPSGYHTLGKVYEYYGKNTLGEYVRSLTGIAADYVLLINGYNLDELVECLGTVEVSLSKDIYFDGFGYTTQYEYTRDAVDSDGEPYVEHIPNTYTLGVGTVELTADNMYILSALSERSMADITMKDAYTTAAVQQYLAKLAMLEDEALITAFESLLGADAAEEPQSQEETIANVTGNPWWDADSGVTVKTETSALFEPNTPVIESDFNMMALEQIKGMLRALVRFENVTLSYPGIYVMATEDGDPAYFKPNTQEAIEQFLEYRIVHTSEETAE